MGQETVAPSIVVDLSRKELIHVLLVDDDIGVLQIAKEYLEMKGPLQVEAISSVERALDRIEAARVRTIITTPEMNPNGKENYKTAPANT
jgi:DNA-binding NtrC family response regulator